MNEQIRRIEHMEACMDRCQEAANALACGLSAYEACTRERNELQNYYESGQWLRDYEADEAGKIPPEVKRGVLSQDALYDLLAEMDALRTRMQDLLQAEQ